MNELSTHVKTLNWPDWLPWKFGDKVYKIRGSSWRGRICGWYITELTQIGYAVESDYEPGAVQLYPMPALMQVEKTNDK